MNNPPAFPITIGTDGDCLNEGMTLRDYFAAAAMQGMIGKAAFDQQTEDMMKKAGIEVTTETESFIASMAYAVADAMLKAREQ